MSRKSVHAFKVKSSCLHDATNGINSMNGESGPFKSRVIRIEKYPEVITKECFIVIVETEYINDEWDQWMSEY